MKVKVKLTVVVKVKGKLTVVVIMYKIVFHTGSCVTNMNTQCVVVQLAAASDVKRSCKKRKC